MNRHEDLVRTFERYKRTLESIMSDEYRIADELGMVKDYEFVQKSIYDKFLKIIGEEDIKTFTQNFDSVLLQREPILKRHSIEYIDEIKSWSQGNSKLATAHYLKILAKDNLTGEVSKKITPVPKKDSKIITIFQGSSYEGGYCSEKEMDMLVQNYPELFLPPFSRINNLGETLYLEDIEILGISNVTGLYDPRTIPSEQVPLNKLSYTEYSRIKNSKRELEKFVLDLLGRREEKHGNGGTKSSPYDDIALTMILPTAFEMYKFKDYLENRADMTKGFFKNTLTAKQNKVAEIKKLQDTYNKENYDYIESMCKEKILALKKEAYKKRLPPGQLIINDEAHKTLYQNLQGKLMIDGVKEEIFVMTPFLYSIYDNELGHNTNFVNRRTEEHFRLLKGTDKKGHKVKPDVTLLYHLFMVGAFKNLCVMSDYSK